MLSHQRLSHDELTNGSSSPAESVIHSRAPSGELPTCDTPERIKRGRIKPTKQPRTAEKTSQALLGPTVTLAPEMGHNKIGHYQVNLDEGIVGTYSCHGQEPTRDGTEAKINQDCACMARPFAGLRGTAMFAVYDGHGKYGHEVSQECLHTISHMLGAPRLPSFRNWPVCSLVLSSHL